MITPTRKIRSIWTVIFLVLMVIGLGAVNLPAALAATHSVCASGCDFTTIQAAIDDAGTVSGDTITIAAGTYAEAVTVNKSALKLIGDGSGTTIVSGQTFNITASGTSAAESDRLVIQGLTITGVTGNGILLGSISYLTFDDVYSTYNTNGLQLGSVTDWIIDNSGFNHNTNAGIRLGTAATVDGLTVTNSHFDYNAFGIVVFTVESGTPASTNDFTNIEITDSSFNYNTDKGLYFEKLSNALFNRITVDSSGTRANYNANAGIDLNLKRKAYSNIEIRDSLVTNSGLATTDPTFGAAITIKARDDAPSYNTVPVATLDNVKLTRVTVVDNPDEGIRIGETGKTNAGPTNVVIEYSRIFNNGDQGLLNLSAAAVTAINNWWGCNDGPNTANCDNTGGAGGIDSDPWLVLTASASPLIIGSGETSDVTADITTNSDAAASGSYVPDGTTVGFASADGTLSDSTQDTASGTATSTFTPTGADGTKTVNVTLDNATVPVNISYDTAGPTVTINQASGQSDPTNSSPINFTVVFSEPVTDFATGDVTVGGSASPTTGTVTEIAPNDDTTYNVAVSGMTASGTVTASLETGVAHDAASNPNAASSSSDNTVTFDVTPLTVTVNQASGQADPTNSSPINFTVVFNKPVTDFATGDVTVGGSASPTTGTVTEIAPNDDTTYNVAVSGMTGDGTVSASLNSGVAHDAANNANVDSTSTDGTVTYDTGGPTVTINQASGQADPTNSSPINFTVVFSEPVTDFATGDVTVGGSAGATTGTVTEIAPNDDTTYNVAVSGMTGNGTVTASLETGVAHDAATNASAASTSSDNTVTYDTSALSVTINQAGDQDDPTNSSPINFTVVFSAPVTDFATGDVTLGGSAGATAGTVTEIAPNDDTTYNVAVSGMTGDGTVTASLESGVAHDAATNANGASTSTDNTVTYDTTAPSFTVEKASGQADPALTAPIHFTVTFDEPVSGFADGDVTPGGTAGATTATVTEIAPNDGTTYDIEVSGMTSAGTVTVDIPANAVTDAAGNQNTAPGSAQVDFAPAAPVVTGINRADPDPTDATFVDYTVTFSQDVSGVDVTDFSLVTSGVTAASIDSIGGDGNTYTVTVDAGEGNGTLRLDLIDDDTITDTFGNPLAGPGAGNGNFTGQVYTIEKTGDQNEDDEPEDSGSGSSGPSPSSLGDDVGGNTGGAITISGALGGAIGEDGTTHGNIYGTVIVQDGVFVGDPASIGNPFLLSLTIKQAINLYGLLPGGVSTFDFASPLLVCMRGAGPVFYVDAETHTVQTLPAVPGPDGYTCVLVPAAGLVVLDPPVGGVVAPLPAAAVAPASTSLTDCTVTTTHGGVRLRTEANTDSDLNIATTVPFELSLRATERVGNWYKVVYGDTQYFVSADFVSTAGSCGA